MRCHERRAGLAGPCGRPRDRERGARRRAVRRASSCATAWCSGRVPTGSPPTSTPPRTPRWSRSGPRAAASETSRSAGATLYASCEPCPLCLSASLWARVDAVVYAADRHAAAAAGFDDADFHGSFDPLARPTRGRCAASTTRRRAPRSRSTRGGRGPTAPTTDQGDGPTGTRHTGRHRRGGPHGRQHLLRAVLRHLLHAHRAVVERRREAPALAARPRHAPPGRLGLPRLPAARARWACSPRSAAPRARPSGGSSFVVIAVIGCVVDRDACCAGPAPPRAPAPSPATGGPPRSSTPSSRCSASPPRSPARSASRRCRPRPPCSCCSWRSPTPSSGSS